MNVTTADVAIAGFDKDQGRIFGYVTFAYDVPGKGECGAAHFQCSAHLDDGSSERSAVGALVGEARRQFSRMPEFLLGQQTLTFSDAIRSGHATAA